MTITSHAVAKLAGVSQPTVSRALRDEPGVSPATRKRVRGAARALGYVPSQRGRSLATRTTRRVGIVAAELTNPFYPALVAPLHDALETAGYRTILITDRGDQPIDAEPLIDGSLDGVLLTTTTAGSPLPHELGRRGVPFVMVNREVDGVVADACVADNARGAAAVADLLADLGHRRVGAILGPETTSTSQHRGTAFREALASRGIALHPEHVISGPFAFETGYQGLGQLLRTKHAPTAVFGGNDVIAIGACNAARAMGMALPDELSLVGFDDIAAAAWEVLRLTTVRVDLHALAHSAAGLLVERMAEPGLPARRVIVATELVCRGTHGPPSARTHVGPGRH